MTTINTPTGWDKKLKSRLEGLTDEQKDQLLELLMEDKKLREGKTEWKSEELINSELKHFDTIIHEIEIMKKSVDVNLNNDYRPIFINAFKNIFNNTTNALDEFKSYIDECRNNKNITSSDIRAEIQDILMYYGLNKSGWINRLMIFLSYSRNTNIKDQMKEHWIDVSLLESICSNITKMLKEINIEVIIPTVLNDKFDNNLHGYKNDDNWIDKFFPNVSMRDCKKWNIYDISSIGYEIKDENGNIIKSKKPDVQYR